MPVEIKKEDTLGLIEEIVDVIDIITIHVDLGTADTVVSNALNQIIEKITILRKMNGAEEGRLTRECKSH